MITKGTIIEVNCSDLGLVTPSGTLTLALTPTPTPTPTPQPQPRNPNPNPNPNPNQVTPSGKVVWGKYAQVTNNPENDGCINAVLLV